MPVICRRWSSLDSYCESSLQLVGAVACSSDGSKIARLVTFARQLLLVSLHESSVKTLPDRTHTALLTYDHLLTFAGEVHFVWRRKFSGATILFALNRYVNLFSKILLVVNAQYWPNQTDQVRTLLRLERITL